MLCCGVVDLTGDTDALTPLSFPLKLETLTSKPLRPKTLVPQTARRLLPSTVQTLRQPTSTPWRMWSGEFSTATLLAAMMLVQLLAGLTQYTRSTALLLCTLHMCCVLAIDPRPQPSPHLLTADTCCAPVSCTAPSPVQ